MSNFSIETRDRLTVELPELQVRERREENRKCRSQRGRGWKKSWAHCAHQRLMTRRSREIDSSMDEYKELRRVMTSSHSRGLSRCPSSDYVVLVGVNFTPRWA